MRCDSDRTPPKTLAMRKSFFFSFFFASDAKTYLLDLKAQEMTEKPLREFCNVGLRHEKSACQIASNVGRAMPTTKFFGIFRLSTQILSIGEVSCKLCNNLARLGVGMVVII